MHIFIGVILTSPSLQKLHPIRKLNYKKVLRFKNRIINKKMEMKNVIQYDIKPDYEIFGQLNFQEATIFFSGVLMDSVNILEQHKDKYPDFDIQRFKEDLSLALKS